jgi:Cation efflux family
MPQEPPPTPTPDLPNLPPPPPPSGGALAWLRWTMTMLKASSGGGRAVIRRHRAPEGGTESMGTVAIAIATDLAVSVAKAVAAALTGSAALFAETLHSLADTGNQLLLLKGLRGTRRQPDASHPYGYGAELFYWSLLAALGIFVVGGVLSIWEGTQRLLHPGEVQAGLVGVGVLGLGVLLDGSSWLGSVRQLRREATARGVRFRQTSAPPPTPRSPPSSTRTRQRCSATRSPSPGSGCTSCSAPRCPMLPPASRSACCWPSSGCAWRPGTVSC